VAGGAMVFYYNQFGQSAHAMTMTEEGFVSSQG
jgi:hypothetical protein